MRIRSLLLCAAALLAPASFGQFDFGGGSSGPAWSEFKLNPKTRVKLAFKNSNVDMVLALYTKLSGITIVKDPNLNGPITITSASAVSLDEAFKILDTTLSLKNYRLEKDGNLLVIRPKAQANRGGNNGSGFQMPAGFDMSQFSQPQSELRVYPIKYANAASVAKTINDVFQGTQDAFSQLMQQFGGGGGGGRFGRFGGGGQGGRFNFPAGLGGRNSGSTVRASSDDYSNTVIVNAPGKTHSQVKDLIDQIDKETDQPLKPRVYKLQYASSDDIAPVIQNVLTTNAPRGRGGAGTQNIPIEQRFQQAFRFGNAQAAFGTVVSEPRTNSIVVTATEDNQKLIDSVIKELDQEVTIENSTFVVPLANARADQVAQLLNQAFGTRGGGQFPNNRTGMNQGNRNNNNNRNPFQNRNGGGGNGGGGGGGGGGFGGGGGGLQSRMPGTDILDDPNSLQVQVVDPNANESELMTEIAVAQGFPFQFGGGGNQQRRSNPTQNDRDENGRLINVRDLTGQVTVIPDPNTNSLIVVTSPGNAALIQSILDQLDRIPEQVMIETIIVEATLDASSKLGVEWNLTQSKPFRAPGTTGSAGTNFGLNTPTAQGFKFTLTGGSLTAFLNALQTDQRFEILSTPRIFTSNNVQAQINISQRVPYITSQRQDANGNLLFTYAFEDVGVILTVTPRITANGQVTMDISQEASELQGFTTFNAPIINQRLANTTVSVKDGESIILGGIIRNTVTSTVKKVPLLGDIPILGNLFKSTDKTKGKTELLVFLTPRVVRTPEEAQKLREEQQRQLDPNTKRILGGKVPMNDKTKQNPPPTKGGDKKSGGD